MKKQALITNKRDKNLLIILLALIAGFALYYFIMQPALAHRQILLEQLTEAHATLDHANSVIEGLPVLQKTEPEEKAKITEKYASFFYDLNAERLLNHIDTLISKTNLTVTSYVPIGPTITSIPIPISSSTSLSYPLLDIAAASNPSLQSSGEEATGPAADAPADAAIAADAAPSMDISISFSSAPFTSVMAFIQELEVMNKAVVIKSLMLNGVGDTLEGQLLFTLYSLPKLDDSEKDEFAFTPTFPQGKTNPFQ